MDKVKLSVNYFTHDFNARLDRKCKRLRKVLGCEGYGIYWMIIETLATQENFSYPLSDIDLLADEYDISVEKVEAVVKQFDLFKIDELNNFFSLSLVARMQKFLEISEKARQNVNVRWEKARKLKEIDTTVLLPYNDTNTIREDNKKEEEINIIETWNSFADKHNLSKIIKLTDVRKSHITNRLKEPDFDLDKIMVLIGNSDFLLGKKADWKIDFDFIFSSKNNYIKILEGKYNNTNGQKNILTYNEVIKEIGTVSPDEMKKRLLNDYEFSNGKYIRKH